MTAILVSIVSGPGANAAEPDEVEYVSLERAGTEIQKIGERCPVRVELALPELELGGREQIVGVLARYVNCKAVRISHIQVQARKGPLDLVELVASAWVIAPKGRDSDADLTYEFVTPDGEEHSASEYLALDEGEINWGEGGVVRVPGSVDLGALRLRVELVTPATP